MKVLFANPPTFEHKDSFFRPVRFPTFNYATPVMHPPLYLAYAASYIRQLGYDIKLIDAPANGISVDDFLKAVYKFEPDIIVFETSTPSFNNDCRVADKIKEDSNLSNVRIVFLGTHVTALPQEALKAQSIDAIVLGEYEFSLAAYIKNGPVNTEGIGYKDKNGNIIINSPRPFCQDLNILPPPARDLLPNYRYFDPILKNPFTFILGGRGCPYPCTFCNWPLHLTGRTVRKRSPSKVVDELEDLQNDYEFKSVLFNDDTFTADTSFALSIAQEIIKRKLTIPWGCYTRADCDDDRLLKTLRQANCFLLKVGVETANDEILKNVKKYYDLNKVMSSVKKMVKYGFNVHATFAFGLPGETHETIKKTINFARKLNPTTVQFSIAVPYPGTEFFAFLDSNGYLFTKNWDNYMPLKPIYEYPNLSFIEMHKALKTAYRKHYFRFKYVLMGIKQLFVQPRIFLGNFKKLLKLVFINEKN